MFETMLKNLATQNWMPWTLASVGCLSALMASGVCYALYQDQLSEIAQRNYNNAQIRALQTEQNKLEQEKARLTTQNEQLSAQNEQLSGQVATLTQTVKDIESGMEVIHTCVTHFDEAIDFPLLELFTDIKSGSFKKWVGATDELIQMTDAVRAFSRGECQAFPERVKFVLERSRSSGHRSDIALPSAQLPDSSNNGNLTPIPATMGYSNQ